METVLVLASAPTGEGRLQLGREHKEIKHSRNRAVNRDQFRVVECMAATVDDLRQYLLDHNPTIVHFCGHGAGVKGLCFEDDRGDPHIVSGERLAELFHLVKDEVQCVVLNACLSEAQAEAISREIDFVVGMKEEIGDAAALKFAQGFYEAIWAGQSYEQAFRFGCTSIGLANIPEEHTPVILTSPRVGGLRVEYGGDTQKMENCLLEYLNSDARGRAKMTTQGEAIVDKIAEAMRGKIPRKWSGAKVVSKRTVAEVFKEVRAVCRSGLNAAERTFYLKESGDSFLIDWEATVGYWPMPFKTFLALGARGPMKVRAIAELSDYFNCGFGKEDYVSVRLGHIDGGSIHGYVQVRSDECRPLVEHLYDGNAHRIVVAIVPVRGDTSHVLIAGLVSDSWVLEGGAATV